MELVQLQRAGETIPQLAAIPRPIDNTAMSCYMTCPREYYFSMVLHRREKNGSGRSAALTFGSAWHIALETHYKTNGDEQAVCRAVLAAWDGVELSDDYRTVQRVLLDYKRYREQFGLPSEEPARTVGEAEGEPLVEISTSVGGGGLIHPWTGKLDRPIELQGGIYIEDHKTTSRLDKNYSKQFDVSNQMLGYTFMGLQLLGKKVQGVRVNISHVLKGGTTFFRELFPFSKDRIAEWVANTNIWLERLAHDYELLEAGDSRAFPGHYGDNGCSRKFGMCQYYEICGLSPRVRMAALEQNFRVEPWNPLASEDTPLAE